MVGKVVRGTPVRGGEPQVGICIAINPYPNHADPKSWGVSHEEDYYGEVVIAPDAWVYSRFIWEVADA